MSDYQNKKKYKKKKAKDRGRKAKAKTRGDTIKAENRHEKVIDKIRWQNRSRMTPLRKVVDEE
jgi:hypothetical protein